MKTKNYTKLALIITWMFIIFNFSAQPATDSKALSSGIIVTIAETINDEELSTEEEIAILEKFSNPLRKSAHFLCYFILAILVFIFLKDFIAVKPTIIIFTVIFCFIYACTDEIHQMFVEGRGPGFIDVLIDTSGSLVSTSSCYLIFKDKKMNKKKK